MEKLRHKVKSSPIKKKSARKVSQIVPERKCGIVPLRKSKLVVQDTININHCPIIRPQCNDGLSAAALFLYGKGCLV